MGRKLVLASASRSRQSLLKNAGVECDALAADIDERAIEVGLPVGSSPQEVAMVLARHKALDVASRRPDALVIGCDQTMSLGCEVFHKPRSREEARSQILKLSGDSHNLNSAVVLATGSEVLWERVEIATLTAWAFGSQFVDQYLDMVGEEIFSSVGGYQLEGPGVRLFSKISGDYFTILGLPLLPLLAQLREMGDIDA